MKFPHYIFEIEIYVCLMFCFPSLLRPILFFSYAHRKKWVTNLSNPFFAVPTLPKIFSPPILLFRTNNGLFVCCEKETFCHRFKSLSMCGLSLPLKCYYLLNTKKWMEIGKSRAKLISLFNILPFYAISSYVSSNIDLKAASCVVSTNS